MIQSAPVDGTKDLPNEAVSNVPPSKQFVEVTTQVTQALEKERIQLKDSSCQTVECETNMTQMICS